jgi:RimJ/RimL family protein N-acetyltransferase
MNPAEPGWRPREPPLIVVDPTATTTATSARGSLRPWHEGRNLNLAIRRRSDGEAEGWVELRLAGAEAEVSYNVTAELRGQGIASRALHALLTWAAQQIGLRRVHLACHIDNLASRRVAQKCGFVLLGQQGEEYQFRLDLVPSRD